MMWRWSCRVSMELKKVNVQRLLGLSNMYEEKILPLRQNLEWYK